MTRPGRREGDELLQRIAEGARKFGPIVALCSTLSGIGACAVVGFTWFGWKGQTPDTRITHVEEQMAEGFRVAKAQADTVRAYADSGLRAQAEVIERLDRDGADRRRMLEDLMIVQCTNGNRNTTARAICARYLNRRGVTP